MTSPPSRPSGGRLMLGIRGQSSRAAMPPGSLRDRPRRAEPLNVKAQNESEKLQLSDGKVMLRHACSFEHATTPYLMKAELTPSIGEGSRENILVAGRLLSLLFSHVADEGQHRRRLAAGVGLRTPAPSPGVGRSTAAASLATRSCAGSSRSSTAGCAASAETGARATTATWRRTISSSRPPMRSGGSGTCSADAGTIPDADDPLFRPIDADDFRTTARMPATSATCARTA